MAEWCHLCVERVHESQHKDSEERVKRATFVPPDPDFAAVVDQLATDGQYCWKDGQSGTRSLPI